MCKHKFNSQPHTCQRVSVKLFGGGHMSVMNLNTSGIQTYNDLYMIFLSGLIKRNLKKKKTKTKIMKPRRR